MELTAQVLRELPPQRHPDLLAGAEHFEDAGVFRITEDIALVQTLDFFPPLVDDPYQFGRVAAANSLSDVYAMGGDPITALNIVAFPDKDLPREILNEILRGGGERVRTAGAFTLGGHSVRDAEIKYGLSVTGIVHPDALIANDTARPGDVLVITKPIGSGTLTSAAKKGTIPQSDLAEAIEVMTTLNKGAREAMVAVGVSAATDVTGFGLLGHVFEMADGADVTMEIEAGAVPLMEQAYELAANGILTRAHKATRAYLGPQLAPNDVDEVVIDLLADAQTSGGLLISVPADRAGGLVAKLKGQDAPCAAVIGRVHERADAAIVLR